MTTESQPLLHTSHDSNSSNIEVLTSQEDLETRKAKAKEAKRKFQIALEAFEIEDNRRYAYGGGMVEGKPTLILCSDDFSSIEEQEAFRQRMLQAIGDITPCNFEFRPRVQRDF